MKFYNFVFRLLGYTLFIEKNKNQDDDFVDIEIGNNKIIPQMRLVNEDQNTNTKLQIFIRYLWILIIFSLIAWSIIYALVLTISNNQIGYIGNYMFQIIFVTQYLFGVWYFKSNHLFKQIKQNKKMESDLEKYMMLVFFMSIALSLLSTSLIVIGEEVANTYTSYIFNKKSSPLLITLFFFDTFFGYLSFLTNACLFVIILYTHKNEIVDYTNGMQEYMESSVPISDKVSRISVEILDIRERFNESVNNLNLSFSSLSALGLIYVFFTITFWAHGKFMSIDIINLVTFLIIEYCYINSAQTLRSSIGIISNKIKLPVYMNNYLNRNNIDRKIPKLDVFGEKEIFEATVCTQIYVVQIIEYQSLQQLQAIVNDDWACFEIFGIQITDTKMIEKFLGIILTIFVAGNLSTIMSFNL